MNFLFLWAQLLSRIPNPVCAILVDEDMNTIDMSRAGRYAIVVTQMMLLCACNTLAPSSTSSHAHADKPVGNTKPAVPASAVVSEPTLNEHNVIEPSAAVAKAGLEVSYNVKHMSYGKEELMQLSLVFRNTNSTPLVVTPKVVITDAKGVSVPVYSKRGFDKVAAKMIAMNKKSTNSSAIQEQLEWDKAFWLSKSFTIPAAGIQIGGLVFHDVAPAYPMKLVVSSDGHAYQFAINDPSGTAAAAPDNNKASECHSPALGTALYVGSDPACRK